KLSVDWIEGYWGFINKIYNAVRFCLMQFKDGEILEFDPVEYKEDDFSFADKWILSRLEIVTAEVNKTLEEMRFNDSAGALYHFFWNEFCDWYIELVKPAFFGTNEKEKEVSKKVLVKVLDTSLKLLHPFMPHVTEELWQNLPFKNSGKLSSIMISRFPQKGDSPVFEKDAAVMEQIIEIITCIRTIRSENNIKPSLEMSIMLSLNGEVESAIKEKEEYIKKLARVSAIDYVSENYSPDRETASAMVKGGMIFISLSGLVDFTEEIARIEKEIVKIQKDFDLCDRKLSNPGFLEKAKPDVIEKEKEKHGELKENLEHLKNRLVEIKK
ncbi:MAG TPA: class I tRNA ligase family protein, partial [bacterium]|nr:class I tRNA ligase family protein [bacterium]